MNDLEINLTAAEQLARGSRWQRLWHAPGRYLYALGFRRLVYARGRRARMAVAHTFFGTPMLVLLPSGTDLYLLGAKTHESETRLARLLIRHLQPGDTFLDVGGHFGYFSLLASLLVGASGRVVTFEASRSTFTVLADNVRPHTNITACNEALSDKAETLSFFEFPVLYNEFNALNVDQYRHEKWFAKSPPVRTDIAATTLDAVVQRFGIRPAIIKIDVEGAELQVISGAAHTLRQQQPLVVMEYLAPNRHNETHRQAAALLRELGYQSFAPDATGGLVPCTDLDAYLAAHAEDSANFVFRKPA